MTLYAAGAQTVRGVAADNYLMRGSQSLDVRASDVDPEQTTIDASPLSIEANGVTRSLIESRRKRIESQ